MTTAVRLRSAPFAETQHAALVDVARRRARRDGRGPGADGGRRGVGPRACRSGGAPVVVGRGLAALGGAGGVDGPAAARRLCTRTVTVVFEPISPSQAARSVDEASVALESAEASKSKRGFRVRASERRVREEVERREHELVAGYGELAYCGLVDRGGTLARRARRRRRRLRAVGRSRRGAAAPARGPPRRRLGRRAAARAHVGDAEEPVIRLAPAHVRAACCPDIVGRPPTCASLYPWHTGPGPTRRGPYLGVNVTGGGTGWFYDPFELYGGALTDSNVLIAGRPGKGKSTRRQDVPLPRDRRLRAPPVHRHQRPQGRVHRARRAARHAGHQAPPRRRAPPEPARPGPGRPRRSRPARPAAARDRDARRSSSNAGSSPPRSRSSPSRSPTSPSTASGSISPTSPASSATRRRSCSRTPSSRGSPRSSCARRRRRCGSRSASCSTGRCAACSTARRPCRSTGTKAPASSSTCRRCSRTARRCRW